MNQAERIRFLEAQVDHLSSELAQAMNALDIAATLGNVAKNLSTSDSREGILQQTLMQTKSLVLYQAAGILLAEDETHDFALELCEPAKSQRQIEEEVDRLIADQSFAWALSRNCATLFASATEGADVLLQPLATPSRVRGMLVSLIPHGKTALSDIALSLLGILAASSAYALESQALYREFRVFNSRLEKKVEQRTRQLMESKQVTQGILESMLSGVVLIDYESRKIIDINPAALRIIGYTREEVVGCECYKTFCPKTRGACPILDLGQAVDSSERIVRRKDGVEVPILKTVAHFEIDGKKFLAESFIDISRQKENEKLREDIERITRHDLRTPLNAILGFPQILLDDENLTQTQREYLGHIMVAGQKMLGMINMSLDLFRMEQGSYELSLCPVDLLLVARQLLADLGGKAQSAGITLRIQIDGRPATPKDSCIIQSEELLCYSMLGNLLKNAVEASPRGGEVCFALSRGTEVCLAIINLGEVPVELRNGFFDKYATSGKHGGTGLGTYSARLMAETLGGRIRLDTSEPGATTVSVWLPTA